ncbi:baseplate J/gp47 family protein [Anaerosporobacter sp.]|uniref:baseplate J/gp47 family protein n=1 Tax=Anaerosporobacter sp. TaxID=1872529 RepID=UPI00286F47F7|nr:baseplate J/gp47 family protein [Anaerosporobacter sp.]
MYEAKTYEAIFSEMMNEVRAGYPELDSRAEGVIGIALAPCALELAQAYAEIDTILDESFADTASREFLIRRAAERGIEPTPATYALVKGVFNIDVAVGARFNLDDYNYIVVEKLSAGTYKLECETIGSEPNSHTGTLIPLDYIDGLEAARITEVLIPGEDEEETESLREKYFNSLSSQSFGGNISDYKEKVNELSGVGGCKVYPTWNGGGTVQIQIIDSDYKKPTAELIETVQNQIDPVGHSGDGYGIAPIGHVVTVTGVEETTVNIDSSITYQTGYTFEDIKSYINDAIDAYLLELAKEWDSDISLVVRISQIEYRLLDVIGIVDISATTINGIAENLVLDVNAIPVRGSVNGERS